MQHDWDRCICRKCKKTRDEQHLWDGCKCTNCGKANEHIWDGYKCTKCGEDRSNIVFIDERDGQAYKYIKIGNQAWTAENLNVEKFRNGDPIPNAKTKDQWHEAGIYKQPAWCYYDNDPVNGNKYNKLYNWYAVNDPRGLAPVGYHIPSDAEWTKLTDYLGGDYVTAEKMKSTTGWEGVIKGSQLLKLHADFRITRQGIEIQTDLFGTNDSGFSALPGGCCDEYVYITTTDFQMGSTQRS